MPSPDMPCISGMFVIAGIAGELAGTSIDLVTVTTLGWKSDPTTEM